MGQVELYTGLTRLGELDYGYDELGRLYKRRGKGFIKTYPDKDGYLKYHLCQGYGDNQRTLNIFVHQVVWKIFHGRVPDNHTIDHIDNDKLNNHPNNLQVLPGMENAVKGNAKLWVMKDPDGNIVEIYNMTQFCKDHNLHPSHMMDVYYGKKYYRQHKGWTKP